VTVRGVKGLAEACLVHSGLAAVMRQWRKGRTLVLAYHNIVPDGAPRCGERSLHLPQRDFAHQLDLLGRTHAVVPLDAMLDAPAPSGRPRAVITFDDAYAGALTAGIAELTRRALPATVFVAPEFVGGRSFWWDELADPTSSTLDPFVREIALNRCAGRHQSVMVWAARSGLSRQDVPEYARAATEVQLQAAWGAPGITFGSHTWSHACLPRLDGADLTQELERSRAWLCARGDRFSPWLSYPYGAWSPGVATAVAAAGYRGALLIEGGWIPERSKGADSFALPRFNVPAGMSPSGFVLRISGIGSR
jgi:peptidoglycan/xylan/chitin deacetylase (PgdA/CDA1 family)